MRKSLWLVIAIILALAALPGVPPARSAGSADSIPPQVVDTTPARGEELPLQGPITFYFDQPMDRPTVESAFTAVPAVKGTFEWPNDSTVTFHPAAPLQRAAGYTFTLDSRAKSKAGTPLKDTYEIKLQTIGLLQVSQVIPDDKTVDVADLPVITIIFNRPVVPLLPVEQMATLPSPITLQPAAEGTGTWLSTSIYTFKPSGLKGGTKYTVTVKKGLTDITGSVLPSDYTSTFTTISPKVVEFQPSDNANNILRDQSFDVTFSQPMDPSAAEAAFSLVGPNNTKVAGKFTWATGNLKLTFKPTGLLDYGARYTLTIDPALAHSATGASLGQGAQMSFMTIGQPDITDTQPTDGDSSAQPYGGFRFYFSAPMNLKDFKSHVTVDPKPGLTYDDYADDQGLIYSVNFSTEPSTSYTITLDTNGLVDKYGTPFTPNPKSQVYQIVSPGKLQFKYTTSAYAPEASLRTGSDIGLYSAYRSSTRVYSTHRNIDSLKLTLSSIPLSDFLKMASNYDYQAKYGPVNKLRSWTLPVANPPNILRYDLLTISAQGPNNAQTGNIACVGAPPAHVAVGQRVVVLKDDPTPLRIRDVAGLTGKVLAQAQPGVVFTVTDGPICADKYIWWNLLSADGSMRGWAAEGDLAHYYIGPMDTPVLPSPTPAQSTAAAGQALQAGAYWLDFESPQLPPNSAKIYHVMLVGTANITLKVTPKGALAWVTDLQSGQPVAGVPVTFYQGKDVTQAGAPVVTDANGLARIDLTLPPDEWAYTNVFAVVNDGKNLGVGLSTWNDGIDTYDFNQELAYNVQPATVYLYTDRSLYRPGQPVYFRGVLRARDDMSYTLSPSKTVTVEALNNSGQSIYKRDVPVNAFGSFSDSFTVDANAELGSYAIIARPDLGKDYPNPPSFSRGINVAEYRVPEFQVNATPEKSDVVQGDKVRVTVDSTYFFGGALSGAKVEWYVRTGDYFFNYKGSGQYSFVDFNEDEGYAAYGGPSMDLIANGTSTTDAQGKFVVEVPADLGKAKQSQIYSIEADVTDTSGQVIAGTVSVNVHQGEFYIGAAPADYVGTAGKPQTVNLVSVDWNSKPLPNMDLSVRAVERQWHSTQQVDNETGRTVWNWDVQETPVAEGVVKTDADGKATYQFTPAHGGIYKVYVTSRDSRGNQITSSAFLWVAGPDYVPWRQQNSNRIDLKIDKDTYKVGDTASVLIASPFQGEATALITVERGHILKTDVVKLPNNSTVYKLPITPDMAPNAYVSVMIVKGVDDKNPVAAFRMGLIQLGVETDHLKLNITVTPDKQQAGPREQVTYKIHVTDYSGKPVKAEVGAGLTDLAVLSLLPDTSTPILDHFYSKQGLAVRTGSTLTISVDQETQQILNTIKGGGGGGPESGIFQVRTKFVDTPLWNPTAVTDDNGDATVSVTLPDQLTTWRLDVRAVTMPTGELNTTLVGQTISDLLSTKPLLIRPITPRFYVVGDTGTLSAIVNNNTSQPQDVTARIEVKGLTLKADATQTGTIASKGQQRFDWPIEVQDAAAADITFYANTPDNKYTDAAKSAVGQGDAKTLPILKYEAPETVGTGGMIGSAGGGSTEGIVLPRGLNITQGTLDVQVEPSLAASTTAALNVLKNYPYQCLEQTVSRFLPNVMTYRALKQLGLTDPKLQSDLSQAIDEAVQRIYAEQHPDGGWGWFVEENTDPLVTSYAVIGLAEARNQGFDIDKNVVSRAVTYLQKALPTLNQQPATWKLNRQAFLLYALADAGAGNYAASVNLFNVRDKMSLYARAYLAMTFHMLDAKNTQYTNALLSDLQNRAVASATGMHWEEATSDWYNWNTDTRSTAIVLKALVEIQPTNALIPNVVRWLMIARKADAWETTQETAWSVMALTDWMQVTGELKPNYTFGVSLNDKPLTGDQTATPQTAQQAVKLQVAVKDLLADQVNKLVVNRSGGDGTLYYTAHLTAFLPVEQVKPLSRGISITRTYSLMSDKDHKPITQAHVGDDIRVDLTIIAPNDLNYLVLSDPIPAGAEALNPDQVTTGNPDAGPQINPEDPLSQGWGWWLFSKTEMRDDRTVLYASYLPAGTYQYTYTLRAGLAGQYRVMPTTGQEFYFPEVYGRSDGLLFTLLPSQGSADPTNQAAATPSK